MTTPGVIRRLDEKVSPPGNTQDSRYGTEATPCHKLRDMAIHLVRYLKDTFIRHRELQGCTSALGPRFCAHIIGILLSARQIDLLGQVEIGEHNFWKNFMMALMKETMSTAYKGHKNFRNLRQVCVSISLLLSAFGNFV